MSLEDIRSGYKIESIELLRISCRYKYITRNRKETTYAKQLGSLYRQKRSHYLH